MHQSSMERMKAFRDRYLTPLASRPLVIADYGSLDVNGSFRALFAHPPWRYLGLDRVRGPNVDVVLDHPYRWHRIGTRTLDVVISGQALEHTELFWRTFDEIDRVLKPGGICCLIAPSSGPEHRYPVDCWRFYPDGLRAVALYAGLEPLDVQTHWGNGAYEDSSDLWHDSVLIARRRDRGHLRERLRDLRRLIRNRL